MIGMQMRTFMHARLTENIKTCICSHHDRISRGVAVSRRDLETSGGVLHLPPQVSSFTRCNQVDKLLLRAPESIGG